uniref:Ubiquitin-like protease family profile domain-containing protein n=1 Tax=Fusarium oxysporum (strain Fo5176) TaxID=660025 RepID=A0A0D2Y7H1_FUSOF
MQSQRTQEAGGPSEVVIMESRETEPEACMYVGSEHVESDSSDNEDIEPVLKTTRSPSIILGGSPRSSVKSPANVAGNNDKRISSISTFRHQEPPEQRPAVSGAPSLPLPPKTNISRLFTQPPTATSVKRKREKESSAMTPQRSMKRTETSKGEEERVDEATAIYKQLTNNVKLTDDTLQFLTKALVSWYPMEQGKVKVLDPLWFKVDGTTTGHNIKLDGYTKLCFSIHHLKPKHWTLAIVDIDDDAKSMVFNHHDSSPCWDRFDTVCASFQKWKETVGHKFKLRFINVAQDNISCGIHVLSCLRHVLTDKPCPPSLNPRAERRFFIRKIKESDEVDYPLQEVKKVIKKQEYEMLLKAIRKETPESLETDRHLAAIALDHARDGLRDARAALSRLRIEQDTLAEALTRLDAAVETKSEPARHWSFEPLNSLRADSQQELSAHMCRYSKTLMDQSFANGSEISRKVLREHYDEIIDKLEQAEKDVAQKQEEIDEATKAVEIKTQMCDLKESVNNILNQHGSLLPWNNWLGRASN